jgi:proline iminopeptidase
LVAVDSAFAVSVEPAPLRRGFFPVAGARLCFRDVGAGAPIVVLHGGPDFDHNYLLPELDRLASEFRLVYYDQRGRGRSARDVDAETVGIDSEMADLDALRRQLGLDAITLLGHSWGAVLALEYATRHPDRVSRLIVVNAAPASHADRLLFRERREATEASRLAKMRKVAATPGFIGGDIAAEVEYYRLHFGATLRKTELLEALMRRLRAHFTPSDILKARAIEGRLYAQTWERRDYDLTRRLRSIDIPTLVVHGDRDFVPLSCARRIAAAARRSRLIVLADCGHFAYLEHPAEIEAVIAAFMRSADAPLSSSV